MVKSSVRIKQDKFLGSVEGSVHYSPRTVPVSTLASPRIQLLQYLEPSETVPQAGD